MDFLLEVGCEEIPARFLNPALENLKKLFSAGLAEARLTAGSEGQIAVCGTPRRLILEVAGLPERQPDLDEEVLGPKVAAAFDSEGQPTKACQGFARSRGVGVEDLARVETAKGEVVAVRRSITGQPTGEVLGQVAHQALAKLSFPKTMRWGLGDHAFARPVHWLLALLDGQVLDFEFAGVSSANKSRGHRFTHPESFEVVDQSKFQADLNSRDVIIDAGQRRKTVSQQSRELAQQAGGRLVEDEGLEEEITFLTECPQPLLGSFNESFLELPREVLIAAMRNHQRYFSVENSSGELLNAFVAVSNTPVDEPDLVRYGNERVLTARLADAQFFYRTDQKKSPADLVPDLQDMIFQADLGSYYEKAIRVANLGVSLAHQLGLGAFDSLPRVIEALYVKTEDLATDAERFSWYVARSALLAKTDLLTEMVGEFPELQGVMGGDYTRLAQEPDEVVEAVRQHYRPRFAGDEPPSEDVAAVLSIADRLDTLVGCFGVGLKPTGTADPYALRRQCLGVISTVQARAYRMSLAQILALAVEGVSAKVESAKLRKAQQKARKVAARKKKEAVLPDSVPPFADGLQAEVTGFFSARLRQRLIDSAPADVVDSVLAAGLDDLVGCGLRCEALAQVSGEPEFGNLAVAFKRVANIIKDFTPQDPNPELFAVKEERELFEVYQKIAPEFRTLVENNSYLDALKLLGSELRGPVDRFFEEVLVNDPDDPERQNNRKGLLERISSLFGEIADFTKLQTREDK